MSQKEKKKLPVQVLAFSLFGICTLLFSACSVPLYQVKPIPQAAPLEGGQASSNNALEVTASALTNDDQAFVRFDANLPLAGVLVVDVKLINHTSAAIKPKFEIRDQTGRKYSPIEPKKALKKIMDFEGVRLYPIEGKEQTLEQLRAIALPKKFILAPTEELRGVLFFDAKQDVARLTELVLTVKGAPEPIKLQLK